MKKLLIAISSMGLLGGTAFAGTTANAPTPVKARVFKSINITKDRDLDFGSAYTGDAARTVAAGDPESAEFTVTGSASKAYSVTPPHASITLTPGGGPGGPDREITVSSFTHNSTGSLTGGVSVFNLGATLGIISNDQEEGDYEGTVTITVSYN